MKTKQEYDSKYKGRKLYWGNKPHESVVQINKYLPKGSSVLDIGCGEGQNACYLAINGFHVTAVDISKNGIEKVKTIAKLNNIRIITDVGDAIDYVKKTDSFDAISGINILQFISASNIQYVIKRLKEKTSVGDYNVIDSFIASNNKQRQEIISSGRYYFTEGELRTYYSGWEIIKYNEKWGKWEMHGEPRHRHFIVRLIARKII